MIAWWEVILRIMLSLLIGGMVGLQREFKQNPAGFRTHILVAMGACIAMLTNEYLFHTYSSISNMDIARMGSYVLSGIGFLGAGSIIKDNLQVRGLTTAAGLWVVACLGIASGAGYYLASGVGMVVVVFVLTMLKAFENRILKHKGQIKINVSVINNPSQLAEVFLNISKMGASISQIQIEETETKWLDAIIDTTIPYSIKIDTLYESLTKIEGLKISSIDYV